VSMVAALDDVALAFRLACTPECFAFFTLEVIVELVLAVSLLLVLRGRRGMILLLLLVSAYNVGVLLQLDLRDCA